MRKVWSWLWMLSLAIVLPACVDSDDPDCPCPGGPDPVVDYKNLLDGTYRFDAEGYCPVAAEVDFSDAMERLVAGHGWIHDITFEIDEEGHCDQRDYYKDMIGVSPEHLYFDPAGKLLRFMYIDAIPEMGFFTSDYRFDDSENSVWAGLDGLWKEEHRVIQLLEVGDRGGGLRLIGLVSLGQTGAGRKVYGLSIYHRATPEELEQLRRDYPTDLSKLEW